MAQHCLGSELLVQHFPALGSPDCRKRCSPADGPANTFSWGKQRLLEVLPAFLEREQGWLHEWAIGERKCVSGRRITPAKECSAESCRVSQGWHTGLATVRLGRFWLGCGQGAPSLAEAWR